jgi:hypothetical protein
MVQVLSRTVYETAISRSFRQVPDSHHLGKAWKSNIQKGWKAAERVELEAFSFEGRRSQSFRKALALGMCKLLPTESINNTETF